MLKFVWPMKSFPIGAVLLMMVGCSHYPRNRSVDSCNCHHAVLPDSGAPANSTIEPQAVSERNVPRLEAVPASIDLNALIGPGEAGLSPPPTSP